MKTLLRVPLVAFALLLGGLPAFADWWYTDRDRLVRDNGHHHRAGCGHVFVDGVWRVQKPVRVRGRNGTYIYVKTKSGWQIFGYIPDRERVTPTK